MPLLDTLTPLIEAADTELQQRETAKMTLGELEAEIGGLREQLATLQTRVDEATAAVAQETAESITALRAIIAQVESRIAELQGVVAA